MKKCVCGSKKNYEECCGLFHSGQQTPKTAEELMRSRYAAYACKQANYLIETLHPSQRKPGLEEDIKNTIHSTIWLGLEIIKTTRGKQKDQTGKVEFIAHYLSQGQKQQMHECSTFKKAQREMALHRRNPEVTSGVRPN